MVLVWCWSGLVSRRAPPVAHTLLVVLLRLDIIVLPLATIVQLLLATVVRWVVNWLAADDSGELVVEELVALQRELYRDLGVSRSRRMLL